MVDQEFDEEVMDDDVEWLMAPVTPPRATVTVSSTYEVGGPYTAAVEGPSALLPAPGLPVPPTAIKDLSTRLDNLEYRHGGLMRKVEEVSDGEVVANISIGEIHLRVATIKEQVQVMESQAVQVVSRLKEIETRVQQVESGVDTYLSGQIAVPGQDVIVGLSQQGVTWGTNFAKLSYDFDWQFLLNFSSSAIFTAVASLFFWQWELSSLAVGTSSGSGNSITGSGNALCILFPTILP
nr:hypothetical protein [Tanacetum cinerariifolium]